MKKSCKRAWPRIRQWLNPTAYLDRWFALLERSRATLDRLLDFGFLLKKKSSYQRRPNFLPRFEGLETRLLPTTVFLHTSTQSVNYNATAIIEADLDATSGVDVTVHYATSDGTAVAGTDYTGTSGTLTIPHGSTSATFTVSTLNKKESSNRTFSATLSSPTNATLGSPSVDTVTIVNTSLISAVRDANTDVVLPPNSPVSTPINSFSNWSMSLYAEVGGASVSSYSWSFASASDAGSISGSSTNHVTFNWSSFTGSVRSDTITLTETATISGSGGTEQMVLTYPFKVIATDSPAYSTAPTSSSTWISNPNGFTPDLLNGQAMIGAGPYAAVGLVDGSAQTSFSLPAYNPNAGPLGLVYNSAVGNPQPTFIVNYALDSSQAVPSWVKAQLTVNGTAGSWVYYDSSPFNKGNTMQIAMQASTLPTSTGRYSWQIVTVANYSPNITTTFSGSFNYINGSTTPNNTTSMPFGRGWSLANVERLWPVTGGVILQNPDGTSLWFASSGGNYTRPAGDFSTLTLTSGVYTRTMPDGTLIKFNSSGQQTTIVDSNGNAVSFAYDGSNQLTAVTDVNSQTNSIAYASGLASSITDPNGLSLALAYTSGNLTSITDPNSKIWTYGYTSNRLQTIQDPRGASYTTTFNYSFGQVSTVNQPDATTQTFTAEQLTGMAVSGGTSPTDLAAGALAAAAFATYTDPNGKVWTDYFDGLGFGRATRSVDPLGNTVLTYRDANGLPWLNADPLGRRVRLFFDSQANVPTVVNADDSFSTSTFNSLGEPLVVTDPHNSGDAAGTYGITTYTYDSGGNLTALTNALSNTTTYTYTSSGVKGILLTVTSPLAASNAGLYTTTYQYDTLNRVTTILQALTTLTNITEKLSYDSYGRVSTDTDPNGNVTTYQYDYLGNITAELLPQGAGVTATYSYTYDDVSNLLTEVTPISAGVNATTSDSYNPMNLLTAVQDPLGNVTTYAYNAASQLTAVTNALTYTTTYTLNDAGQVTAVTIPLAAGSSAITTYTLDAAGEVTTIKNALSQVTSYTYNSRGWLSSVTDALNNSVSYGYNASGDQTTLTQTDSNNNSITTSASYFLNHLLKTTTDALSNVTSYTYDVNDNLTATKDANSNILTYTYDALNRVKTSNYDLATTTYERDSNGNVTKVTDPLSHVSTYTFDFQNRLSTQIDPNTETVTYSYNLAGWLTSVKDPNNNLTTYAYNNNGWLTTTTNANSHTATYAYDAAGELTARTDFASRQTTYSYNRAGWRTGETWVSGSYTATYGYDNAGEMTAASDTNSTYTFTYYNDGSLNKTAVSYPGLSGMGTVTLTYSYDGYGNRTSLADSATGSGSITYSYNSNFQLTALNFSGSSTTASMSFSYGNSGRTHDLLTTITMVGGSDTITAAYSYDFHNRLTTIAYSDGAGNTLPTLGYTWNSDNQLTQFTSPQGTLTYAYDHAGQLTAVTGSESYTYGYDSNGNRNTTGYTTTTGNQMSADPTYTSITYDANGNLTSKGNGTTTFTYTWDYRNRLTKVVATGGTSFTETLTYDVFGNQIGMTHSGGDSTPNHWTVYDGANPYIDFNGTGTLTTRYLTNPQSVGQMFGRVTSGGTASWYLTDLEGSVREIIDKNGNVLDQTIKYDPFGQVTSESTPGNGDRFKFQGGEWDSNLKLYRFGARWNDPAEGRWISQDPLGFGAGDSNLYRYVNNQPTDETDPSGNWTWQISPDGRILAASEKGDTLSSLIDQGYGSLQIADLASKQWGTTNLNEVLKAGNNLDVSSFFPPSVINMITDQQNLPTVVPAPFIAPPSILGPFANLQILAPPFTSFFTKLGYLPQPLINAFVNPQLGSGQCYSFVAQAKSFQGFNIPSNNSLVGAIAALIQVFTPKNVFVTGSPGEGAVFGFPNGVGKPAGVSLGLTKVGALGTAFSPLNGLEKFLKSGPATVSPKFGAMALFTDLSVGADSIAHAGIVMGTSQAGDVYIIQKQLDYKTIIITKTDYLNPWVPSYYK